MEINTESEDSASEQHLRRLERERRLKEIEESFQNIDQLAKQQQQDIYSNVFTERGQEESLQRQKDTLEAEHRNHGNNVFSKVSEFISQKMQNNEQQPPSFHVQSPTGVASFPDIEPVGVAKRGTGAYWNRDNHHNNNGRVRKTVITRVKQFATEVWSANKSTKKTWIVLTVFFLFIFIIAVLDARTYEGIPLHVSEETLTNINILKPVLEGHNIDNKKLSDYSSPEWVSMLWLAEEITLDKATIGSISEPVVFEESGSAVISFNEAYKDVRTLLERFVLLVLYHSTNSIDAPWQKKDFWLTEGLSVCSWYEVKCTELRSDDISFEVVSEINLSSNRLSGTIPDVVSKLEGLRSLLLENNFLYGQVPSSLGQLSSLQILEISNNELTGEVPESVCRLREYGDLTTFISDCGGSDNDIECSPTCCTECI
mmetsp:Transcript_15604/g.18135  ORF Transcript_15604/g.18135 Transcript_15604/m.18135 type:complete len:428 (+) Transcript_15604:276-1559(+)